MRSLPLLVLLMTLGSTGCAVVKVPVATGGSRADGTVQLSYEYGLFERPQVDWGTAQLTAVQRCRAWGYGQADPFQPLSRCLATDGSGNCVRFQITTTYQCTGAQ